jgi:predicted RNase H-like nuclease (RuvC/YqgF family)
LTPDVFKNMNNLKKVFLKDNDCINRDYEYLELLPDLKAALSDSCSECDPNEADFKICQRLRKLNDRHQKIRDDFQSKLTEVSSANVIIQGNVDSMDSKIDSHMSKTNYDLNRKEADLEKKLEDEVQKLQREIDELKKNSAVNVFSWKVHVVMIAALMFCRKV